LRRLLIFGLLGPVATYLSISLLTRSTVRWTYLPLGYGVEILPFVLCGLIDLRLAGARAWERVIVAGIAGFMTSAVIVGIAAAVLIRGHLAFMAVGFYAILPAAACSLLSTATDRHHASPIE
jgi:hypothetical protein